MPFELRKGPRKTKSDASIGLSNATAFARPMPMASRTWDAYRALNITGRESSELICSGESVYGTRCSRAIANDKMESLHTIMNNIEKESPGQAISVLPQLAQLTLCENSHQKQAEDIIANWTSAIMDAADDYQNREAPEIRHIELRRQMKEDEEILRRLTNEMQVQLRKDKADLTKCNDRNRQIEAANKALTARIEQLESSLARSDYSVQRLQDLLVQQRVELSAQLSTVRNASKEYKIEAGVDLASRAQMIEELRAKLEEESRISSERLQSLESAAKKFGTLNADFEAVKAEKRQESVRLGLELKEAMTQRTEFFGKWESLRVDLATIHRNFSHEIAEAGAEKAGLLAEIGDLKSELLSVCQRFDDSAREAVAEKDDYLAELHALKAEHAELLCKTDKLQEELLIAVSTRTQLANERNKAAELRREISTRESELLAVQVALKRTQIDLEKGRKASYEEKAAEMSRNEAYSRELEKKVDQSELNLKQSRIAFKEERAMTTARDEAYQTRIAQLQAQIKGLEESKVSTSRLKLIVAKLKVALKSQKSGEFSRARSLVEDLEI